MNRLRAILLATMSAVPVASARASTPAERGDLAIRSRAILHKYCVACHDKAGSATGDISVLDAAGLDRAERPWLVRGSPDASELMRLIEDGSMPPGTNAKPTRDERDVLRAWLTDNAPPYPARFDENYVLGSILADVRRPGANVANSRYFSLHNTIPEADASFLLESRREALRKTVAGLSAEPNVALTPIDPLAAIFRVDLGPTGWARTPYEQVLNLNRDDEKQVPSNVKLFDAILLEYPFGTIGESDVAGQLATAFLKPAGQAVPIAYLRGDWFVAEFASKSPVAAEIRKFLKLPAPADQSAAFDEPKLDRSAGKPIVALDAVTREEIVPEPAPFDLTFQVLDSQSLQPRKEFVAGDKITFRVTSTKAVRIQIVWTDASGKVDLPNLLNEKDKKDFSRIPAGIEGATFKDIELVFAPGRPYEVLTIYASEASLPPPMILKTKTDLDERVIHPWYTQSTMTGFDPARVVKKSVRIKIREK